MDTNQIKCAMCGSQFNSQEELDAHTKQMHSKTEENKEEHSITCSKCGMKAKTTQELDEHVQQHSK